MSTSNLSDARWHWAGSTSRSLLAHARLEDRSAWARLVHLYAPMAAGWCRRQGVAEQDVADVLQEVFAAVANNLARFRKDRPQDTFRGWLATIARNKVHDYHRRRAIEPSAQGGTEASLRLAQVADHEAPSAENDEGAVQEENEWFHEVLLRALDLIRGEFHEQTWQAFWGVVVDGRSTRDVAQELAMQPGAVRVAKSRVLARLRRELGDAVE
jgi:RNA polymerase sigma-70 factor (ECF subfamily)